MKINNDKKFINDLIERSGQKNIQERIHYFSYLNVKNGLRKTYDSKLNQSLILKLAEYEKIISDLDKPVDKLTSLNLYNTYIYPAGYHLERKPKYKFVTSSDFQIKIIIGLVIDFTVWYFLDFGIYLPIFFLNFTIKGLKKRKIAKKNGRYFALNY